MEKDDGCGMELIWVKPAGSQERQEVSWFERAGVHVINDILCYPVPGWSREILLLLIWEALCMSCIPRGAVGCSAWAGSSLKLRFKETCWCFNDG